MRYADAAAWTKAYFNSLNYDPMPIISPGPASDAMVQKAGAGRLIFLTVGAGPGFNTEQAFDGKFITIRVIGRQGSYEDAENMALDLDRGLTALDHNGVMGNAPFTHVARSGGSPLLLQLDNAQRYHFTCSYVIDAQTEG